MKIRLLEKELEKSGYSFHRNGKGSHRIFKHEKTSHTVVVAGKKGSKAKPYQLKFLRAKSRTIHTLTPLNTKFKTS